MPSTAWPGRRPTPTRRWRSTSTTASATSRAGRAASRRGWAPGVGSPEEWAKLLKAYDFKDDQEAIASKLNPVDHLARWPRPKVPILLVYGDSDRVVPHRENSEVVYDRYKALGGPVERIVKPEADHHPHGLTDPRPIVEFFERAWQTLGPSPSTP